MDQMLNETAVPRKPNNLSVVKAYLQQVGRLPHYLASLNYQMSLATEAAYTLPSPSNFENPRVQTSQSSAASFTWVVEDAYSREEYLKKYVLSQYELITDYKCQVVQLINQYTDGTENLILTARYIAGKTWKEIASEVRLCEKQVHRICEIALSKIVLPEDAIWVFGRPRPSSR